jgi:aryl-alcohol dehydrogenase-like predicted oxidoreductase
VLPVAAESFSFRQIRSSKHPRSAEETIVEKRQLGKTDMQVSILGFGGAEIGFAGVSVEDAEQIIGEALDAGLNVIDTAECYNDSEELIGRAVGQRRDDYYLFTKCGHASDFDLPDWDPNMLEQSIERSLRRLRTDCVDLVQLHSCSEELLRQGDVIAVLQWARDAGKTRYIGYSGDSSAALYALECGAFDTLQTSVNIADQEPLDLTLPLAVGSDMGVIAKRPLANVAWKQTEQSVNDYHRPYWERLRKLAYDFLRGDINEAVGIALLFTLSAPGVHTAIVGTTKPGRWRQNAELLAAGPLPQERIEAIRDRWKAVAGTGWTGQG